jgi:hypothetical protein
VRLGVASAFSLVLGALVLGCGEESDGTFDREGFPFTFDYPESFQETDEVSIDQSLGADADETAAVGLDDDNILLIQVFTLNLAIDESNLNRAKQEIDDLLQQVDPDASSKPGELAGLPTLTVHEIDVPSLDQGKSRLTFLFDGDREYQVNCQFTPDHADEIGEACDQALETFALK